MRDPILLSRDEKLSLPGTPCVATIGNFDGVHRGHQWVIEKVVDQARQLQLPSLVITFEPAPQKIIRPELPYHRLMRFSQKLTYLQSLGVTEVLCLRFNPAFSKIAPLEFSEYIVKKRKVRHLIVCKDFRFGHEQRGNSETLRSKDCTVEPVELLYEGDQKISSTRIRLALQQGQVQKANDWLGRHYSITGRVAFGAQRGRLLGFPTANLPLKKQERLLKGIYITQVTIEGKTFNAVTNMGCRPTVDGETFVSESHLLDFSGNIYGKRITVSFIAKIRDEMRFTNKEALCEQITRDVTTAQQFFTGDTWTK